MQCSEVAIRDGGKNIIPGFDGVAQMTDGSLRFCGCFVVTLKQYLAILMRLIVQLIQQCNRHQHARGDDEYGLADVELMRQLLRQVRTDSQHRHREEQHELEVAEQRDEYRDHQRDQQQIGVDHIADDVRR